jgi:hypothetical protein
MVAVESWIEFAADQGRRFAPMPPCGLALYSITCEQQPMALSGGATVCARYNCQRRHSTVGSLL